MKCSAVVPANVRRVVKWAEYSAAGRLSGPGHRSRWSENATRSAITTVDAVAKTRADHVGASRARSTPIVR